MEKYRFVKPMGLKTLPRVRGINKKFWVEYGHPDEATSFLARSKMFTVCHAKSKESEFYNKYFDLEKNF